VDKLLAFDAETKEYTAKAGEAQGKFNFSLTNISSESVVVNFVQTSCGCTVAKLPSQPWTLAPGDHGEISATMNIAGHTGTVTKTLTVNTDKGSKVLYVKSIILPAPAPMSAMNREENQKIALADRQAVFKGDCASCHVEPAKNKMGRELYAAACGICHDGEHRNPMVPDLHALKEPTNPAFWKNWIEHGKPGTLMPSFAQAEGGFLSEAQIASLVNYLSVSIPSKPASPAPVAQQ
jgi:mono/diheme cytochrome c family protein